MMELAAHHFGITFPLALDRRSFNKSVNSSLYRLRKGELAEPLHSRELGSHGVWRWKAAPALEALRAQAGVAADASAGAAGARAVLEMAKVQ